LISALELLLEVPMSLKISKIVAGPALLLGLASPFLLNCGALGNLTGASCDELKTGDFANFKLEGVAPDVEAKFKGLLDAVYSVNKLTIDMETGLIESCGELGKALGMPEADLKAEPSKGEGAKKVCEAVAAKIGGIVKANAEAKLSIEIGEPKCGADVDALIDCFKGCGVTIDPGKIAANCEGGEISGKCDAECKGSCSVEGGVACKGKCDGTCEGKCDGKDAKGAACSGKCDGKCGGSCKIEGSAKCEGTCSGGCTAEIKAPKCSTEFKPPSVSADCQMNCAAKTAASVTCSPPTVKITNSGKASADIDSLIKNLQVSVPKIAKIQLGLAKRLVGQVKGLATACAALPDIAKGLVPPTGKGVIKAGFCAAQVIEISTGIGASLDLNVSASASIGGSISGSASASASGGTK